MGKDDAFIKRRFVNENGDGSGDRDVFALKFNHKAPNTDLFLATCRNYCSVFRCNADGTTDRVVIFTDSDDNEAYYTCDWSVRDDGTPLVLVAGRKGIIQIYALPATRDNAAALDDTASLTLEGHMEEINDLQVHPTRPHLVLSAGHDNFCRLWDLRAHVCVAVFGGPAAAGHMSAVTCVAWQCSGPRCTTFVSGGWDGSLKVWDINSADRALKQAAEWPTLQERRAGQASTGEPQPNFPFAQVSVPTFTSPEVHADMPSSKPHEAGVRERQWVDCVACVGPAVISRSGPIIPCASNCNLKLWRPLPAPHPYPALGPPLSHCHKVYKTFNVSCKLNIWWIRFALCAAGRVLAAGSDHGVVYLHSVPSHSSTATLLDTGIPSVVRSTAVSADGRTILAGTSCGRIYRWDRRTPAKGQASASSAGPSRGAPPPAANSSGP